MNVTDTDVKDIFGDKVNPDHILHEQENYLLSEEFLDCLAELGRDHPVAFLREQGVKTATLQAPKAKLARHILRFPGLSPSDADEFDRSVTGEALLILSAHPDEIIRLADFMYEKGIVRVRLSNAAECNATMWSGGQAYLDPSHLVMANIPLPSSDRLLPVTFVKNEAFMATWRLQDGREVTIDRDALSVFYVKGT